MLQVIFLIPMAPTGFVYRSFTEAMDRLVKEEAEWINDCYVWLYRGAWQEWDIADMEMTIPIGPKDMERKKNAIFKHQSQKDAAMFPGNDSTGILATRGTAKYGNRYKIQCTWHGRV